MMNEEQLDQNRRQNNTEGENRNHRDAQRTEEPVHIQGREGNRNTDTETQIRPNVRGTDQITNNPRQAEETLGNRQNQTIPEQTNTQGQEQRLEERMREALRATETIGDIDNSANIIESTRNSAIGDHQNQEIQNPNMDVITISDEEPPTLETAGTSSAYIETEDHHSNLSPRSESSTEEEDDSGEGENCPVCQKSLTQTRRRGPAIGLTGCNHKYHLYCSIALRSTTNCCAVCRAIIVHPRNINDHCEYCVSLGLDRNTNPNRIRSSICGCPHILSCVNMRAGGGRRITRTSTIRTTIALGIDCPRCSTQWG